MCLWRKKILGQKHPLTLRMTEVVARTWIRHRLLLLHVSELILSLNSMLFLPFYWHKLLACYYSVGIKVGSSTSAKLLHFGETVGT